MANCCANGLNQVFCNAFNKYYNTLYTNGEISKEETNNLLIIDYIRQCLSDDRYNSYYSILLKAFRCIANNSCLLDTSWLYDRSVVPKVTNLFVTVLTKQAFVETDPIFSASPAATITDEDINNWNNPSASGALIVTVDPWEEPGELADYRIADLYDAWLAGLDIVAQIVSNDTFLGIYQLSWIQDGDAWFFMSDSDNTGNFVLYLKASLNISTLKDEWLKTNSFYLQLKLTFDNNPTQGSNNPVKSSGIYNMCPIIEDTRSSNSGTITGNAPFDTLVDGQMIILHLKQNSSNNTLTLTLSDNTTTGAIPVKITYQTGAYGFTDAGVYAGDYYQLRYEQAKNRWITIGRDRNNVYGSNTQAQITAGTDTTSRLISPKIFHDNAYIVEETYSSGSLKANKFYDFGTVSSALTIPSLDATNDLVSNALNFYALRFIAGADNLSITFPTGVLVDDTPTINTGDYVEIMINKYGNNFYASIKVWQAQ